MKYIYTLLMFLFFGTISIQATVKIVNYKIQSGDTLYSIAHKNHTTIEEVRKMNHLQKGATLKLGKVLRVPTNTYFPNKKTTKKSQQKIVKHHIKKGETLYTIAHAHHTTIDEVRKINNIKKGELLKLGRVIRVPQDTYFPNQHKVHTVKYAKKRVEKKHHIANLLKYHIRKGDTLSSIARIHHVSVKTLLESNHMQKNTMLKYGHILYIPQTQKYIAKHTKKRQSKILVTSLSKLETVKVTPKKTVAKNTKHRFSLKDIFFFKSKHSKKSKGAKIISLAKKKLGKRYVWGATGDKNTFDCSGFTTYVYKKNGIKLPRRAIAQSKYGKYVPRKNLQKGDLIFFDTSKRRRGYVNHVGIYLGNGKFIHASSAKKKVVITSLKKKFYSQRYKGARRPS